MTTPELAVKISNTTKFWGRTDENWEQWVSRFEARFRDVKDAEKRQALVEVLDGAALDAYAKLEEDVIQDYAKVKAALQTKFGKTVHPREAHAELRQIKQRPGETEEAFGDRILDLMVKASPGLAKKQLQTQALHHFLCGLNDVSLQENLNNRDDIVSLQSAIEVANKCREKATVLKAIRASSGGDVVMATRQMNVPDVTSEGAASLAEKIDELRGEINTLKGQIQGDKSRQDLPGAMRCYQCGDTKHLKRNCPQRGQAETSGRSQGRGYVSVQRNGSCFQCGDPSHWKRDCPQLRQQRQGAPGPSRQFSDPHGNMEPFCYGCGALGHWMAACWRIPQMHKVEGARRPEHAMGTQDNTRKQENQ